MRKPSQILSEQQLTALMARRDVLMSEKLDRSRRVLPTREIDEELAWIETRLIAHRSALAKAAGVMIHG
jgi:hypothetical protein